MRGPLTRPIRITLLLSTLVAAVAVPQAAQAKETATKSDKSEKKKVAVGGFEGNKSSEVRSAFIAALKKDGSYEVTDAEDVKSSAKAPAIAETAKSLDVDVVITGKVQKAIALKLKVMDGKDGSLIDEVDIKAATLAKLKTDIRKKAASSIEGPVAKAQGPEEPEAEAPAEEADKEEGDDKPEEDEEAPADTDTDTAPTGDGLSPLNVTAGLRPIHRTFEFHQTAAEFNRSLAPLLRYELPLGPALFIDLNWYPASHFTSGPAEWFGITAGFEKGFATESVAFEGKPQEQTLKTDQQAFYAGLRVRVPIAVHELGLTGTYGQHQFGLSGDETLSLIPDVKYSYVKVGLDANFRFGDFLAGARVGKRFVSGTGGLEDPYWFPQTKATSLEAGVTVGYRLVSMLDLVVGFDWLRYAFGFNPNPMRDAANQYRVAGGAVDQYLTGFIGFRFHLPGRGDGGGAAAPAPAAAASTE